MSFVSGQRGPTGTFNVIRTVLFWVLMIALIVVLWQMSSRNTKSPAAPQMSYSEFMGQVDANNVSTAHLYESPSTAEIRGQLRQPPTEFRVTIPKESIPALTERLRKQDVLVRVSSRSEGFHLSTFMMEYGWPLIFLAAIFLVAWQRFKRGRSPQAGRPSRPIG